MNHLLKHWKSALCLLFLASHINPLYANEPSGKIAFVSNRDNNKEIYVMNADGTGLKRLTHTPKSENRPSWSPDGTRIAFVSHRDDGDGEIYVMNADGSDQRRLTYAKGLDSRPTWSPDGTKIAFQSRRHGETSVTFRSRQSPKDFNTKIYVMNADGTDQVCLTNIPGDDMHPSWSPDGKKLAFGTMLHGGISTIDIDGKNRQNLTIDSVDWAPNWSPDGSKIVFYSRRSQKYTGAPSGHLDMRTTPLTNTATTHHNWKITEVIQGSFDKLLTSAMMGDKKRTVYFRSGNREIYVMNADGSGQVNLTDHPGEDGFPCWAHGGEQILFHSNRDLNYEIYMMNPDGTGLINLTNHPADDSHPSLVPSLRQALKSIKPQE